MKRKIILSASAIALVSALSVAGTMAWLTDSTGAVRNTFTVGNVGIALTETFNTDTNDDDKDDTWTAKMIPGNIYSKDPCVTVDSGSENCWLFIRIKEDDTGNALNYTINDGWEQVPDNTGFYYRENVLANEAFYILKGKNGSDDYKNGFVTISEGVTSQTAEASLTFTAAAVQYANISDVGTAFDKLPTEFLIN